MPLAHVPSLVEIATRRAEVDASQARCRDPVSSGSFDLAGF